MFPEPCFGFSLLALLASGATASPTISWSSPLTSSKTATLVARQYVDEAQRNLYCRYNPVDCQGQFPGYCDGTVKRQRPLWCNDDGERHLATKAVTLVSRQEGKNSQRMIHCHYNPADCYEQWPEYCTQPSDVPPDWCLDFRRAKRAATVASTTNIKHEETLYWCDMYPEACRTMTLRLVAEADSSDNLASTEIIWAYPVHSICRKNPEWPECIYLAESRRPSIVARNQDFNTSASDVGNDNFCSRWPSHEYCNMTYCWQSGHACPARLAAALLPSHLASPAYALRLAARQEADPTRIKPDFQDPPQDTRVIPDPPETRPIPVTSDWCDQHPHHSFCNSKFCIDHPNQCKTAQDPNPLPERRAERCAEVYKDFHADDMPKGCELKCFDGKDRRGECSFRTHEWCQEHPDHRDCEVPT